MEKHVLYGRLKGKAKESFDEWYAVRRRHENNMAGEDVLPEVFTDIKLKLTARVLIVEWVGAMGYKYSFQHTGGIGYEISMSDVNYRTGVGSPTLVYDDLVRKCVQLYNEGKTYSESICLVCEKKLHRMDDGYLSEWIEGGTTDTFSMGFGSNKDMNNYRFFICDECVEEKENKNVIRKFK